MSFAAAARQSLSRASLRSQSALRAGARRMNSSTSHAEYKPRSNTPWIIGSAIIFGPAFLYLVSPSARKSTHSSTSHDHAHDSHRDAKDAEGANARDSGAAPERVPPQIVTTPQSESEPESEHVVMKDDEGTEADVTDSVKAGEQNDAPKASNPSSGNAQPSSATSEMPSEVPDTPKDSSADSGKDSSGTFQQEGDKGPTNMSDARRAAAEDKPPKKVAEEGS